MVRSNGSLGWVVPGVMGAALARPKHRAVAVSGDGGLLYHIGELETALRCNVPVVIVVLNNSCLASEYHTEKRLRGGRVVSEVLDFSDTDFGAIAKAFGAHGARVNDNNNIKDAIRDAYSRKNACLVDVVVSKEAVSPLRARSYTQGLEEKGKGRRARKKSEQQPENIFDEQNEWQDSLGLEGKVVAVLGGGGANNGIGRATAILFAKLGAKVAVLDINIEAATETAQVDQCVTGRRSPRYGKSMH